MSKTNRKNIIDTSKTSSSVKNKDDIKALEPGYYEIKSSFGKGGTKHHPYFSSLSLLDFLAALMPMTMYKNILC